MAAYDNVRTAVAKTDALAHALEKMFDEAPLRGEIDRQRLERLAHLVGATAEAAAAALVAVDTLNPDLLNHVIPGDPEEGAEPGES
jgi:hypothetical protein